jgi:putative ABC transport system ATP-binding protein
METTTHHVLRASDLVMDYAAQLGTAKPVAPAMHMLALNHVNFAIRAGESIAVMGPSGSGKSTLLHVLAGIVRPTAGNVSFRGTDLAQLPDADCTKLRRSAFGFVFQSGQLLPELPAVENIALPMMLGGARYQQAADTAMLWLERLGLRQLAAQRPGEMSGGQMQRVSIARALAVQPAVVFADEPTGALDQSTGRDIMGILMDASRANGAAVIVVTHDPNVAAFCDRTLIMRDGQLYDEGPHPQPTQAGPAASHGPGAQWPQPVTGAHGVPMYGNPPQGGMR